jgi:dihydrofolate synthase/folylpolyglutamate synthase
LLSKYGKMPKGKTMVDHAHSAHAGVQQQLDRLTALSPGRDVLGLERIRILCSRLGDPQLRLPRTFHVAGTNGKGSTCANLRAMLEAQGRRVHAYSSPHLVRFNERIRLAGALISDEYLAELLSEVLDIAEDLQASFFEVTTAAALLAFARVPADDVIIEVGLGGRLDATNIIPAPAVCGIASLAIDHEGFLLAPEDGVPQAPLARIAFEKSGIIKSGTKVATLAYPPEIRAVIADKAQAEGVSLFMQDLHWRMEPQADGFLWAGDGATIGPISPALHGPHQQQNAGLALAMLRLADGEALDEQAAINGISSTVWPGRIQRLDSGPLADILPSEREIWIDGGHNLDAAQQLARYLQSDLAAERPVDLIVGMLSNKDASAFIGTIAPFVGRMVAVPIDGHEHHQPADLVAIAEKAGIDQGSTATSLTEAMQLLASGGSGGHVLIGGSLYLVGLALEANQQYPE